MKYYTIDQVADHLQLAPKTVRNWISGGKLPHIKFGNGRSARVRVSDDQLRRFIKKHEVKAEAS